jgi:hypothetical protein
MREGSPPPFLFCKCFFFLYMFLANQRFIFVIFSSVARSQVPSQAATHQEMSRELWAGETPDSNPGLQDNSLARCHWATMPPYWAIMPPYWATMPPFCKCESPSTTAGSRAQKTLTLGRNLYLYPSRFVRLLKCGFYICILINYRLSNLCSIRNSNLNQHYKTYIRKLSVLIVNSWECCPLRIIYCSLAAILRDRWRNSSAACREKKLWPSPTKLIQYSSSASIRSLLS